MKKLENKKNNLVEKEVDILGLKVTRELLNAKTIAGNDMYAYFVRKMISVNGVEREFRAEMSVKSSSKSVDYGGYEMLDIIFMMSDEAHLSVVEDTMTNEITGEFVPFTTYEIWNQDDEGTVYSYKIKPMRESDKAKLNVIIQKRMRELELEAEAAAATVEAKQPKKDAEKENK